MFIWRSKQLRTVMIWGKCPSKLQKTPNLANENSHSESQNLRGWEFPIWPHPNLAWPARYRAAQRQWEHRWEKRWAGRPRALEAVPLVGPALMAQPPPSSPTGRRGPLGKSHPSYAAYKTGLVSLPPSRGRGPIRLDRTCGPWKHMHVEGPLLLLIPRPEGRVCPRLKTELLLVCHLLGDLGLGPSCLLVSRSSPQDSLWPLWAPRFCEVSYIQ